MEPIKLERRKIVIDDGVTKLGGYNVGRYPIHHFIQNWVFESQSAMPLKLMAVGDDEWIEGCYRYRRNSDIFAVEHVVKGGMDFTQNGKKYHVGPGQVYLSHLGADNDTSTGSEGFCLKKTMIISGTLLPGILAITGLANTDVIKLRRPEFVACLIDKAYAESRDKTVNFMQNCSATSYHVLMELSSEINRSSYPPKLQMSLEILNRKMNEKLSVAEICESTGMSSVTLHRLFKKHIGMSPINYYILQKMEAAKELLAIPFLSIKEISQQLGYSNQLYFSAEFRKHCGASPKQFRMNSKNKASG
ncbi:MAG TPA: hypothetical protein DET40_16935 [Lentisphaeria bacterium]|nr:MAG: hypothetical protein A2X45_01465 [Lentisphaerae bacterium GWF2_50_93]HCE45227.1 hypothetical protein [Lentisphaeria bacterium]